MITFSAIAGVAALVGAIVIALVGASIAAIVGFVAHKKSEGKRSIQ